MCVDRLICSECFEDIRKLARLPASSHEDLDVAEHGPRPGEAAFGVHAAHADELGQGSTKPKPNISLKNTL